MCTTKTYDSHVPSHQLRMPFVSHSELFYFSLFFTVLQPITKIFLMPVFPQKFVCDAQADMYSVHLTNQYLKMVCVRTKSPSRCLKLNDDTKFLLVFCWILFLLETATVIENTSLQYFLACVTGGPKKFFGCFFKVVLLYVLKQSTSLAHKQFKGQIGNLKIIQR